MKAIEPELKTLLPFIGITAEEQTTVFAAYDKADTLLINWTDGTTSTEVVEALDDFASIFTTVVQAANLPEPLGILVNTIVATVTTIVGLVTAKSPAPAAPAGTEATASTEEVQAAHASAVEEATKEKVTALVPDFKRSLFHSAQHQQHSYWNGKVDDLTAVDPKYSVLHVAA